MSVFVEGMRANLPNMAVAVSQTVVEVRQLQDRLTTTASNVSQLQVVLEHTEANVKRLQDRLEMSMKKEFYDDLTTWKNKEEMQARIFVTEALQRLQSSINQQMQSFEEKLTERLAAMEKKLEMMEKSVRNVEALPQYESAKNDRDFLMNMIKDEISRQSEKVFGERIEQLLRNRLICERELRRFEKVNMGSLEIPDLATSSSSSALSSSSASEAKPPIKQTLSVKSHSSRTENDDELLSEAIGFTKGSAESLEMKLKEKCLQDRRFVALYGDTHPSPSGEKFVIEWRNTHWFAPNANVWLLLYRRTPYFVLDMMDTERQASRRPALDSNTECSVL